MHIKRKSYFKRNFIYHCSFTLFFLRTFHRLAWFGCCRQLRKNSRSLQPWAFWLYIIYISLFNAGSDILFLQKSRHKPKKAGSCSIIRTFVFYLFDHAGCFVFIFFKRGDRIFHRQFFLRIYRNYRNMDIYTYECPVVFDHPV